VNHQNIVSVFDVEDATSSAFIAMEIVEGLSLQAYLDQRGTIPPEQAVILGLAVARALDAAHARGVLHLDIKPGNVLLGLDGAIKVADFGLAALVNSAVSKKVVFGTPGYIAPEAATGNGHDARTDLYALGVVLYHAVTGSNPFERKTSRESMIAGVSFTPPPLTDWVVGGEVLLRLSTIVQALMAKKPEDRPQTAAEAARRLETLVRQYSLHWRLEPREGIPLRVGHGAAALVPTISLHPESMEVPPR
jgi:serine/threonine-protein kinase